MGRDAGPEPPRLPVAVPRPSAARTDDPFARRDDDDDAPIDWRIGGAVVGFLWAAFTSLMLSVAPPAVGSLAAWVLATAVAGLAIASQWLACTRHAQARAVPPSAARQALQQRAPAGDVDRVEERLDKDPA
jgi:hypothetical protein